MDTLSINQLLVHIGLLAASNRMFSQAETIFSGLEANEVNAEVIALGRSLCLMNRGGFDDALLLMTQVKAQDTPSVLDAFMALACIRQGYATQAEMYLASADQSSDPTVKALSNGFRQLL